jgi:hypothetical protein
VYFTIFLGLLPTKTLCKIKSRMSFAIVAGSLVLNFLVPFSYFFYVTRIKGQSFAPYRAIDSYLSGMIGDTLCVPLINLFLFKSVYGLPVPLNLQIITLSFILGVFAMAVSHVSQALAGPINWSMPTPWRWSFPGKYHMLSSTIQYAFMSLILISIFFERGSVFSDSTRLQYFSAALFFAVLFLIIFALDYRKKE